MNLDDDAFTAGVDPIERGANMTSSRQAPRGQRSRGLDYDLIESADCLLTRAERLTLASLVFARRPRRFLEVGSYRGGSARIVLEALDAVGDPDARMVMVDIHPQIREDYWEQLRGRAQLFTGDSARMIPEAARAAGGAIDFALIDGDHNYKGALGDLEILAPWLAQGAYVLCHDAHYHQVDRAIAQVVKRGLYQDAGIITNDPGELDGHENGLPVHWGGFRLLCRGRRGRFSWASRFRNRPSQDYAAAS
jgi:predicted O-methyltransferase YrrM